MTTFFTINFLKFTIPGLILTLVILSIFQESIEMNLFISFFLIFFSLINIFNEKKIFLNTLKFNIAYLH